MSGTKKESSASGMFTLKRILSPRQSCGSVAKMIKQRCQKTRVASPSSACALAPCLLTCSATDEMFINMPCAVSDQPNKYKSQLSILLLWWYTEAERYQVYKQKDDDHNKQDWIKPVCIKIAMEPYKLLRRFHICWWIITNFFVSINSLECSTSSWHLVVPHQYIAITCI